MPGSDTQSAFYLLSDNADALIKKYQLDSLAEKYGINEINLKKPVGCDHCSNTGYRGRFALTEYLRCDDTIKQLPKDADFISAAKAHNASLNRRRLLDDGLYKCITGATTIDEVLRVAG